MDKFEIHVISVFPYIILSIFIYIVIDYTMPGTWQKQKIKYTRIDLQKFNRCLSTSQSPLSFNCYQRQNMAMEYFYLSWLLSRAVQICEMVTQLISKGWYFEGMTW